MSVMLLKRYPHLVRALPPDRIIKWPYYLNDITVMVDLSNPIERPMLSGIYDRDLNRTIKHFVKSDNYCIDVGANVGPVTLLMAKLAGPDGRVISVEPGPPYYQKLLTNLHLNPRLEKIITPLNMGISDKRGELFWQADPEHPYNAGLLSNEGISVPVDTLDAVIQQQDWDHVDFIKIDVEGMELEVFKGSNRLLNEIRPVVLFETLDFFKEFRGFDIFKEIETLLSDHNYKMYYLTLDNKLVEVKSHSLPFNTLAVPVEY